MNVSQSTATPGLTSSWQNKNNVTGLQIFGNLCMSSHMQLSKEVMKKA